MHTPSHFSSPRSALVLGSVLLASSLFATVTWAQSLIIPTGLTNAVITIQKIFLSASGTSTNVPGTDPAKIILDGSNGNLTAAGDIRFTNAAFTGTDCNTDTGCILRITTGGKVAITTNVSPWLGNDEQVSVFKRTPWDDKNIYLAKNDGSQANVGNNNTQSILRVGTTINNIPLFWSSRTISKPDTAMIVAGAIESRWGLLIRKFNNDSMLSNTWPNNLKANIESNYTELDLTTTQWRVNFISKNNLNWNSQNTSFLFNADEASTKVGINSTAPQAELHVDNGGKLLVGNLVGGCFLADTTITLADGSTRDIQDVKLWDKLKAVNGTNTVINLLRPVLGDQPVYAINNNDGFFTANHPFLTTKGWKSLDPETTKKEIPNLEVTKLQIGDLLITRDQKILVVSLTPFERPATTQLYNFSLDGDHTYFANDYAVHNKQACIPGQFCNNSKVALYADGINKTVGIWTSTPQKSLDVQGNAAIADTLTVGHPSSFNPGTDKLAINGNTRANAYYYNSDRRYKSDITPLSSALENLLKISGYHYFSKLENKDTLGVIAQEVETVYPELVQTDSAGYKSVQYGNLVAPIIEAIRELSTKIDHLFTLYVSQQAKIDTLEARLLKLETKVK